MHGDLSWTFLSRVTRLRKKKEKTWHAASVSFFLLDSQTGILLAVIVLLNYVVNIKSGNEAAHKQQIFMLWN